MEIIDVIFERGFFDSIPSNFKSAKFKQAWETREEEKLSRWKLRYIRSLVCVKVL